MRIRRSITLRLLMACGVGLGSQGPLAAQPPVAITLHSDSGGSLVERVRVEGLPALSADGASIAVLDRKHPMDSALSVLLLDARDGSMQRESSLLSDEEGSAAADVAGVRILAERVEAADRVFETRSFAPMASFFVMPTPSGSPVERFVAAGHVITFDRRSGVLIVLAADGDRESLRWQAPKLVQTGHDTHPHDACILSPEPAQAWLDAAKGIVVLRIEYRSGKDGCDAPERWVVEALR